MRRYLGAFVGPGAGQPVAGNPATLSTQIERFRQPVYDRVNYPAAGIAQLTFFSVPIGGTATLIRAGTASSVAKTLRDTYLRSQGVLPNIAWWVYGVHFCLIPATVAPQNASVDEVLQDAQILIDHGYVEFRTVDKVLYQFALASLSSWHGVLTGASTVRTDSTLVGAPIASECYDLTVGGLPLFIDRNQQFSATLTFDGSPALTQTWDILWVHDAEIERPS